MKISEAATNSSENDGIMIGPRCNAEANNELALDAIFQRRLGYDVGKSNILIADVVVILVRNKTKASGWCSMKSNEDAIEGGQDDRELEWR
jgi:hypothetical protein